MEKRIVAIGRQFGSGGHTVGVEVAKRLGIPCYDDNMLGMIADECGYDVEFVKQLDQAEVIAKHKLTKFFMGKDEKGKTFEDYVWEAQQRVIKRIVEEGPCVIVGRCADYLLANREDTITVFIYASHNKRAERILSRYGEDEKYPIDKLIENKDSRRAAKYERNTGQEWGKMDNYDVCLDSGKLTVEGCVDIIVDMVNESKMK